jgi:hypothetical protein
MNKLTNIKRLRRKVKSGNADLTAIGLSDGIRPRQKKKLMRIAWIISYPDRPIPPQLMPRRGEYAHSRKLHIQAAT